MDALARLDEACRCGRPSRVVLAPRCWRQASWSNPLATGAIKPGTPGRVRSSR